MRCNRPRPRIVGKPATRLSKKDWHSGAFGAVVVAVGCHAHSEILPRRLHSRGGASVVGGMPPQTERRISNVQVCQETIDHLIDSNSDSPQARTSIGKR